MRSKYFALLLVSGVAALLLSGAARARPQGQRIGCQGGAAAAPANPA